MRSHLLNPSSDNNYHSIFNSSRSDSIKSSSIIGKLYNIFPNKSSKFQNNASANKLNNKSVENPYYNPGEPDNTTEIENYYTSTAFGQKKILSKKESGQQLYGPSNKIIKLKQPYIYRGLYLNNHHGRKISKLTKHIKNAKKYGINVFVVDVQPKLPTKEHLGLIKKAGIYSVARLVCFEQGLRIVKPTKWHMNKLLKRAVESAKLGFDELQLDYIRYADYWGKGKISIKNKYKIIQNILQQFKNTLKAYKIKFGADLFGRIAFNQNDIIGQRLEIFAEKVDVIYPMLYPSHFTGDNYRMSRPYETIYEGVARSINRINASPKYKGTKIVAYIQAFKWRIKKSGLSFTNYIYRQIVASERVGYGWVAWNARNNYTYTWKALELIKKHGHKLVPDKKIVFRSYKPKVYKKKKQVKKKQNKKYL
jgi:hypothetical protein